MWPSDFLYGAFTNLFISGWLAMMIAAFLAPTLPIRRNLMVYGGRIVPAVLLIGFTIGWIATRDMPGELTSFHGVVTAYQVPEKVLTAWIEILGLALLIAHWMIEDATQRAEPRWILIAGLLMLFPAAALGWVGYMTLSRTRTAARYS